MNQKRNKMFHLMFYFMFCYGKNMENESRGCLVRNWSLFFSLTGDITVFKLRCSPPIYINSIKKQIPHMVTGKMSMQRFFFTVLRFFPISRICFQTNSEGTYIV